MKEIYKDIPGYEGMYQVSNLGNVKSLDKKVWNGKVWYDLKGRKLKKSSNIAGYLMVCLSKKSKTKTFLIHQLIAITFLNHKLNGYNGLIVDHINNIKIDNKLDNIQLLTARKNTSKNKDKCSSEYTGVCWSKYNNKWKSQIRINGKQKYLGYFENEYDAHLAYQEELKLIEK